MAIKAGDMVVNVVTGERATFLESTGETSAASRRDLSVPSRPVSLSKSISTQARGSESIAPMAEPLGPGKLLSLVCILWLLNSTGGAAIALREELPAKWIAGVYVGKEASAEFFKGGGTALSPGLIMMAAQAVFTLLSARGGRAGMAGAAGLTVLGVGATVGVLGETITYRVLSPSTFDPPKAAIVLAAVILAPLMTILGGRRLRTVRSGR